MSGGITQHPDSLRFWIEKGIAPVVKNAKLGRIQLTHINLNDATVEGLKYLDQNTFSTQFHPGLNPGLIKSNTAYDLIAQILANK